MADYMDYPNFDIGELDEILFGTDFEEVFSLQEVETDPLVLSSTLDDKGMNVMQNALNNDTDRPTGGRFRSLDNAQLEELEEKRQSKSTKRNTQWGLKLFQELSLEATGDLLDFKEVTATQLDQLLRRFYAEATPKHVEKRNRQMGASGAEYHKNTLKNIRGALNRHLQDIGIDFDIVRDKSFKSSNNMLDAKLKSNLEQGLSLPTTHKSIISKSDLSKISTYLNCLHPNPIILRHKVWYDLAIHFVSRGLEFHAQLTPRSFHFQSDEMNTEFVTLTHETKEKTRRGGLESEEGPCDKRMYTTNNPVTCPVNALKLFLSKTDPQEIALFNHCNKAAIQFPERENTWYIAKPVKNYQFSRFLSDISKQASCSKQYTSHCLRATAIQTLSDAGFELRHIMYMSGHRNESSIRSYSRECSTEQKKALSKSLASMRQPDEISPLALISHPPAVIPQVRTETATGIDLTQSHVTVSQQTLNRNDNNSFSAGILLHSSFNNCTILFYGNNAPF